MLENVQMVMVAVEEVVRQSDFPYEKYSFEIFFKGSRGGYGGGHGGGGGRGLMWQKIWHSNR